MRSIKLVLFLACMTASGVAAAIPMPDFIVYGNKGSAHEIAAYWNDAKVAEATIKGDLYRLPISMDTDNPYHQGAVMELWVDGQPTGRMITVGAMGSVKRLDLAK